MRAAVSIGRASVAPSRTYAEYQEHIATLATSGVASWGSTAYAIGAWRVTAAASNGPLTGSTWISFTGSNFFNGAIRHGLPSQAAYLFQQANGFELFVRVTTAGNQINFIGQNRNGLNSTSYNDGTAYPAYYMTQLIFWDGDRAWITYPSTGIAPAPYDWT